MGRPKGSKNKPKVVQKSKVEMIIEPVICKKDIRYILACDLTMPTQYTKWLCRANGRWIVNNQYQDEFLKLFPEAKIQIEGL